MAVSLAQLSAASAGPELAADRPPTFLSVGDSLMWGQGLLPQHRFRELARARIAREHGVVAELAMARSGAEVAEREAVDDVLRAGLLDAGTALSPLYSPEHFAREIPNDALTIGRQLEAARDLIDEHWPDGGGDGIRWILMDGGINDIGIFNILTPFRAELDDYALRCWPTWLLDEARRIEDLMFDALATALDRFPAAAIVVNGYFPVFSLYSLASIAKLQSVGILYGVANLVLTHPYGLQALANASTAWQAASTHHLRRAIRRVQEMPAHAARTVLFARPNIEGPHCLFGPRPWLWGYDNAPDSVPANPGDWVQWLAGATPEDEVIPQRVGQCNAHEPDVMAGILCRLASLGHPNVPGAVDYAEAIIDVMERAGVLVPDDPPCVLAARARVAACRQFADDGNYRCFRFDARACTACSRTTNALANAAEGLVKDGAGRFGNAGRNFAAAADCFQGTQNEMEEAAAGQFAAGADNFAAAADHVGSMADCWDDTHQAIQACADDRATRIAECNHAYDTTVNTTCNIRCNSFTNCNRFRRWDPRRYACRAARAGCVAAAAVARGACIAGAFTIREGCRALAEAQALGCDTTEIAGRVGCTLREGGQAVWEGVQGVGRGIAGVGAALVAFGGHLGCALGNTARAMGNAFLGAGEVLLAGAIGGAALGFYLGCAAVRGTIVHSCQLLHGAAGAGCRFGTAMLNVPCTLRLVLRPLPGHVPR